MNAQRTLDIEARLDGTQLSIELRTNFGAGDCPENSAFFRPFAKLRKNAHKYRLDSFVYVFLAGNGDPASIRLLASVQYLAKGRLLYYPGLRSGRVTHVPGRQFQHAHDFVIDHLTLEPNLQSIHMTMREPKRHQKMGRTKQAEAGFVHLFGFTMSNLDVLEPVPATGVMHLEVPARSARQRQADVEAAVNHVDHVLVTLPDRPPQEGCWHADFFLDSRQQPTGYEGMFAIPAGPPELTEVVEFIELQSTLHDLHITQLLTPRKLMCKLTFIPHARLERESFFRLLDFGDPGGWTEQ